MTQRPFPEIDRPAALALNAAHEVETAPLDAPALERLLAAAVLARAPLGPDGAARALLIVLDEAAGADSPNFRWFAARRPAFLYVDRVIVAPAARGAGLARSLYAEALALAAARGVPLCAEINADPPNPVSDAFHAALGFAEIGRAPLPSGKTVRYVERAPD